MVALRKNKIIQTTTPGQSIIIRSCPQDANPDEVKNFYIVDIITRDVGGAAYQTVPRVLLSKDIRKLLGIRKNEIFQVY